MSTRRRPSSKPPLRNRATPSDCNRVGVRSFQGVAELGNRSSCVLGLDSVVDLDPEEVGAKALRLAQLKRDGFLVAPGFVVTERAFVGERLSREGAEEAERFRKELGKRSLVVRSSAPGEDAAEASHAGVYESFLDVEGGPDLREAIER